MKTPATNVLFREFTTGVAAVKGGLHLVRGRLAFVSKGSWIGASNFLCNHRGSCARFFRFASDSNNRPHSSPQGCDLRDRQYGFDLGVGGSSQGQSVCGLHFLRIRGFARILYRYILGYRNAQQITITSIVDRPSQPATVGFNGTRRWIFFFSRQEFFLS